MDLQVNFAGLTLEHPLMNAAGTCKLTEHVRKLARSASAAVVLGSITVESRSGNSGNVFWRNECFSLNSLGLPNPGKEYYRRELPLISAICHDQGKPLIVSVAGFSSKEYGILAEVALEGGADLIELNLGCPNVWDEGKQKRIACFDLELVEEILFQEVLGRIVNSGVIGVKVSPFSDPMQLEEFARFLAKHNLTQFFLTAVNTFPNALAIDEVGIQRITPAEGLAGLAGPALKPIALGQIRQYRNILTPEIQIAGAGGVQSGQDMRDFQRVGAAVIQMNTAYGEDERVFERVLSEYVELLEVTEKESYEKGEKQK